MPTSKSEMSQVMDKVFSECNKFREAGQKEYAHKDENAFANFERVAERLGIDRKSVLMVYVEKHIDGIHSFIKGHKSQREDVRGRINDVIVYLCLLRGMIDEELAKQEDYRMVSMSEVARSAAEEATHPMQNACIAQDTRGHRCRLIANHQGLHDFGFLGSLVAAETPLNEPRR